MASRYPSQTETTNFARLSRLVLVVCSDVLRDVLDTHIPPPGLHAILNSQKHNLRQKLGRRQLSILYPPGNVFPGTLKDLDFSLLYNLVRNIQGINISPHTKGWGREPDAADRSLAANIDRLRVLRNKAFGDLPKASLSDTDFGRIWGIIRQCVSEIEQGTLTGDTYVREVDNLLTLTMDPDTEKKLIQRLQEQQVEFERVVEGLKAEQKAMAAIQESMARDIKEMKEIHPDLKPMIETTINRIRIEKEKQFLETKAFHDAQAKLRMNRVLVIKGNTGDGKTSTAFQLVHWLMEEQCRKPLQLHKIKELDLLAPNSNLVCIIDDIFGEKDIGRLDVQEWNKRLKDVETLFANKQNQANILLITIRNEIFNALTERSLGTVFTEENIVDLGSDKYNIKEEKQKLLAMYTPTELKWTQEKQKRQQQQQFMVGIAENVETPFNITITVVGHKGVGKSCFVRQLQKEFIPEGGPGSTDTADFYVNYLGFNQNTGFRKKLDENGEEETGRHRIKQIIDRYLEGEKKETSSSTTGTTSGHTDPDSRTTPSTIGTGAPRSESSSLVTTSEQPSSSSPKQQKSGACEMTASSVSVEELSLQQKRTIEEVMDTKTVEPMKGFITIYDFGGEEVFYNTHHCLMSDNMVFVLVVDVAMCLDPYKSKEGYDKIEFWLRSFATYAVDHTDSGKGTPPVILIGSHLDVVSPDKEKQNKAFAEVLQKLNDDPELRDIMETHVQNMYPISHLNDSTKNHDIYEIIWEQLVEIAPLQSRWGKPVPARWLALEHEIVKCKRKGDVILTYDALMEINSKSAVPLAEEEIPDFLTNLQLAGAFLCFDREGENAFVILKPQWILNAFRSIITDPKFTTALTTKLKLQWTQYERSGKIKIDFIRRLWGLHESSDFLSNEKRLFRAMETLGLLAKPLSDKPNEDIDYYIVPSMLQPANPEKVLKLLEDPETIISTTLCLKFDNPFIPQAVWDKMIATCIHRFQGLQEYGHDGTDFFQRGFVCLSVDFQWKMIINCSKNVMKITMFKKDKDRSVPTGAGVNILNILKFHLNRILEMNHQSHLGYQFYLHNDYRFTDNDTMVKVDDLRKTQCVKCHSSNRSRWIEKEEIFIWFKQPCQKTRRIKSDQFNMVMNTLPDRNLSVKEVGRVSKYIGKTLQNFFVELGCLSKDIEQKILENSAFSCRTLITKIFIHLLNKEADVGFTKLADVMTENGMNPASLSNILDENRETMFNDENFPKSCLLKSLTKDDAQVIAKHVSSKVYFIFFLELGLSPKRIDEFDINYRNDQIVNQITAMMKEFVQTTMPTPTLNTVLLAMQECDMGTQGLIERLSSL